MAEESSDECPMGPPKKMPKVVIIGGGISGISAAHHLINSGFEDITILEASNRIGGRIHSIDLGKLLFLCCPLIRDKQLIAREPSFVSLSTNFSSYKCP